jgi:glycosyltransferase involved in cell wall biosynthesis
MQEMAVLIASHMSRQNRIHLLIECITSLLRQTIRPHIYLSISFETALIHESFETLFLSQQEFIAHSAFLHIFIRSQKTAQMRHYQLLSQIPNLPQWILFCDDDDTYAPTRVAEFSAAISTGSIHDESSTTFAGAYESTFGKTHEEQRHEYWCYCVHHDVLRAFYSHFYNGEDLVTYFIDHVCCDVLFGEYLRRLGLTFHRLSGEPLYNYRRETNEESITGDIMCRQRTTRTPNPPDISDEVIVDYVLQWNDYLQENLHIYLHDTFLRTIVGVDFDTILRAEFQQDYPLLEFVDEKHVARIKELWLRLREGVCRKMYRIPF